MKLNILVAAASLTPVLAGRLGLPFGFVETQLTKLDRSVMELNKTVGDWSGNLLDGLGIVKAGTSLAKTLAELALPPYGNLDNSSEAEQKAFDASHKLVSHFEQFFDTIVDSKAKFEQLPLIGDAAIIAMCSGIHVAGAAVGPVFVDNVSEDRTAEAQGALNDVLAAADKCVKAYTKF